jgi:hypothetical protein
LACGRSPDAALRCEGSQRSDVALERVSVEHQRRRVEHAPRAGPADQIFIQHGQIDYAQSP